MEERGNDNRPGRSTEHPDGADKRDGGYKDKGRNEFSQPRVRRPQPLDTSSDAPLASVRQETTDRFPLGFIFGVALALLATGGGLTWFAVQHMKSTQSPPKPTASPSPKIVTPPVVSTPPKTTRSVLAKPEPKSATETIHVYWFDGTKGEVQFNPIPISVQKAQSKAQTLEQAFRLLLAGPVDATHTTAIPKGTKLLGLREDRQGIHIDLSQSFTQEDGSDLMVGRLAQVIYTATNLNPKAKVWIDVEGKPLEVLGEGHGLMVDRPMTRKIFEENFDLNGQP